MFRKFRVFQCSISMLKAKDCISAFVVPWSPMGWFIEKKLQLLWADIFTRMVPDYHTISNLCSLQFSLMPTIFPKASHGRASKHLRRGRRGKRRCCRGVDGILVLSRGSSWNGSFLMGKPGNQWFTVTWDSSHQNGGFDQPKWFLLFRANHRLSWSKVYPVFGACVGMSVHEHQLFWCEHQSAKVFLVSWLQSRNSFNLPNWGIFQMQPAKR